MSAPIDASALFVEHRAFLVGLAYRMLGSVAEAEDAVQEAFARAGRVPDDVQSPRAWLATVVTRICLDHLRSARARREVYTGPWLPEPVRTDRDDAIVRPVDPADAESLSLAFLALLERLSPLERAVFVLREVFDYTSAEVASVLGRDEAAIRQLLHRAKTHVREGRPRFAPDPDHRRELLMRFLAAVSEGEVGALESVLAEDAIVRTDGGGKVHAARKPVTGANRVARFVLGVVAKTPAGLSYEICEINGQPGLVWRDASGTTLGAMTLTGAADRVESIDMIVNPEKLSRV